MRPGIQSLRRPSRESAGCIATRTKPPPSTDYTKVGVTGSTTPKAPAMASSFADIWAAFAWGAVSSAGLLIGAVAGLFSGLSHRAIAMAMSVGAGLLLAAVSLKLAVDAVRMAGPLPASAALLLGAAVFSAINALLAQFGAAQRKRCGECTSQPSESEQPGSGTAIALGTALDALPEALVLGLALRQPMFPLELVIALGSATCPRRCRVQPACERPAVATATSSHSGPR